MINIDDIESNTVKLEYGTIELCVDTGGWSTNYHVHITWYAEYYRPELEMSVWKECLSLEEAVDWYKEQDLLSKTL